MAQSNKTYNWDGQRLSDEFGIEVGRIEGNFVRNRLGHTVGEIEGLLVRDRFGKRIAELDGWLVRDALGFRMAPIEEARRVISGAEGITLVALWVLFGE